MEEKIAVLESQITDAMEKKHWNQFEKQSGYKGNGIYEWRGQYSTDTRELFLLGIAVVEGIEIED
jgi:hypothetical protein